AVAQLRLRFAEKGEVDFIEIAQRAAAALGSADDPGELLLKLDASIRHLLIDEFQAVAQLRLRFAEKGEVDFIEIAQRAAAALGSAD
ncbi:hypothetical protein CTI14_65765, partial [Methylobacterium radiotolerans]